MNYRFCNNFVNEDQSFLSLEQKVYFIINEEIINKPNLNLSVKRHLT